MPTVRSVVFSNNEYYHVFNRGIDRRQIFSSPKEYQRMVDVLSYYRFSGLPLRYSQFQNLEHSNRVDMLNRIKKSSGYAVRLLTYCLMPNHFHLLLKQETEGGISSFISKITNSYTKFINTKLKRKGPLFEGIFKAVRIETEEQLIHVNRYIHLNPVASLIIPRNKLYTYPWSSLNEYIDSTSTGICDTALVLSRFKTQEGYKKFLEDQIEYAQVLEKIKHIVLDD